MARMPGAEWRPTNNCTKGGQEAVRGVVLHVMAGTLAGSDSWFKNPAAQASAHFGIGKAGEVYQWVDTADRAWAQAGGNRTWLSIEHEGQGGDALTPAQLAASARVIAWMHETHGVLLQATDSVDGRGIGWHGMGGAAWGGHTACPGTPIKAQRPALIAAAKGHTTSTSSKEDGVNDADVKKILTTDGILNRAATAKDKTNAHWTWASHVQATTDAARAAEANTDSLIKKVDALTEQVAALAATIDTLSKKG